MPRPKPIVSIDAHVLGLAWQSRGLCRGLPPDIFFPDDRGSSDIAKRICAGCPVRAECLEYALAIREPFGVWGGASERDRRRITKARRIACSVAAA